MGERSLYRPDASALELLRQRAQVALDIWIGEWAVDQPPSAAVTVSTAIDHEQWQGHTCHQLRDAKGSLWVRASVADRSRLTRCIFGPDPEVVAGEMLDEIIDMAALARAEELRAALFGESPLPIAQFVRHLPVETFAVGSGAVQMVCNPFALRAIVDAGVWCALPRQQPGNAR